MNQAGSSTNHVCVYIFTGAAQRAPQSRETELLDDCTDKVIAADNFLAEYEDSGRLEDLQQAISMFRDVLTLCPPEHPLLDQLINGIATALQHRFEVLHNAEDLEECISFHREALSLRPPGHTRRSSSLSNLAICLRTHYEKLDNVDDLDECISLHREALSLRPPGHRDRTRSLNNLAIALHSRYKKLGNAKDVEECLAIHREALSFHPPGHVTDRARSLKCLANALSTRYDKLGNANDLEDNISLLREALSLHPPGHPGRSNSLNDLVIALDSFPQALDNAQDVEEYISLSREALSFHPPGHSTDRTARARLLKCLANALGTRYKMLGNANDLEDRISLLREELSLHPPGHPRRSSSLIDLAIALRSRFDQLGDTVYLNDSIALYRDALSLSLPGHPDHPRLLNNLAVALRSRYEVWQDAGDLEECISLHHDTLNLFTPGHLHRSISLNNLAAALKTRYYKLGNTDDLENCISLLRDVLTLNPPGHDHHSGTFHNLATALSIRYDKLGNVDDLEDSISLYREALSHLPLGQPYRSTSLTSLGESLMTRHARMGNPGDLSHAFLCFEQATSHSTSYIRSRILAATRWVKFAYAHNHETIFSAYTALLQLINHCLIFRPNVESQQRFLANARDSIRGTLASDAASAAIAAGNMELAVEFLEQGRDLLWDRVDAYKYPLHELRQVRGGEELADRLQAVSTKLERLSLVSSSEISNQDSSQDSSSKAVTLDLQMKEHRLLSEEWENLVGKVREIEGFSHFLRAAPFHILRSAAAEGPIILVNISIHRSDAIIILEDNPPELVNLPEVLLPQLRDQKCGSAKEIINTLAYLWDTIVSPIVDRLKEIGIQKGSRIWWCPTAELCALPLHAAGRGKRNLHDIYVSSYTSTLSSLIKARSNIVQQPMIPKILAIGQPSTDLKRVQDEVDIISKLRPGANVLFGPDEANREAVLGSLQDHSWVHFACHGILGDDDQPFQASFKLHEDPNRRLRLLDLVQARLPNAEFAFLSACHSAAGGLATPDENIHLSAALQFCGFKSVVGTLWEMDDEDGPTISEKFYKHMFRNPDRIDFRDSAYALNSAIKEMRKAKVPLDRLAMFVHIGA